jgi:hypothetical protein
MKKLCALLVGLAICVELVSSMAIAKSSSAGCQMMAMKKADSNFKTNKLVTGLVAGGVTVYTIRKIIEKSKAPPKGAAMSRGGGVLLRDAADRAQWDKFYRKARAECHS